MLGMKKFPPGKAYNLWIKINNMLEKFHEISKSAHGDLNPGNIIVTEDLEKIWFIDPSCNSTDYFKDEDDINRIKNLLLGDYD